MPVHHSADTARDALAARDEAFGSKQRQRFHMQTNYRNAREIFDYAADVIRRAVPDADIPEAVRETGIHPVSIDVSRDDVIARAREAVTRRRHAVEFAVLAIQPVAIVGAQWHVS